LYLCMHVCTHVCIAYILCWKLKVTNWKHFISNSLKNDTGIARTIFWYKN
jgi:hypothetical protein